MSSIKMNYFSLTPHWFFILIFSHVCIHNCISAEKSAPPSLQELSRDIQKNLNKLEFILKKATISNMVDEALRLQITELSEDLGQLKTRDIKKRYHVLYGIGELGLKKAKHAYQEVKSRIQRDLIKAKERAEEQKDFLFPYLLELANHPEWISVYAEKFEEITGVPHLPKGDVRCGTTARAVLYYLSMKNIIPFDLAEEMENIQTSTENLVQTLEENSKSAQKGFLYYCQGKRYDHVFIIEQLRDGYYKLVQSYIKNYSLKANLSQEKYLTKEEMRQFLQNLSLMNETPTWNRELTLRFEKWFHTRPLTLRDPFLYSFYFTVFPYRKVQSGVRDLPRD